MSTTRRTLLAQGLGAAVAALLARLPRTRPSPTGPVPLPEFGGPQICRAKPWVAYLVEVDGVRISYSYGEIVPRAGNPEERELVFLWRPGDVSGTVVEVIVCSPLGHEERRMISPLTMFPSDSLKVTIPLRLDGGVA